MLPAYPSATPFVLVVACLTAAPAWAEPDLEPAAAAEVAEVAAVGAVGVDERLEEPIPDSGSPDPGPKLTLDEAAELLGLEDGARQTGADPVPTLAPSPVGPLPAPPRELSPRAKHPVPVELDRGMNDLRQAHLTPEARITMGALGAALVLGTLLALTGRRRAVIHVQIEYPEKLRGTYCVRLRKRSATQAPLPRLSSPHEAEKAELNAGGSKRDAHYGISRETLFVDVPCRRWYVSVDGFVQTGESPDVVAAQFQEQELTLRHGESQRLSFDFQPRACPVEVRVVWDQVATWEAQVARYGVPTSMRLVRGPVQFSLDHGAHTLLAGANDRVAEAKLEIESYEPRSQLIDLGDRDQLVFSGCPRAVAPYLHGDVAGAARALDADGQSRVASLMLARFHASENRSAEAAHHYARAGDWVAAAEVHESLGEHAQAGKLYERAEEHERAAQMFREAGDLVRAGDAFLKAEAWENAADCFREAGDSPRWQEALTKLGQHLAAAKLALEQGDRNQAIQCLRRVGVGDDDYPESAVLLAEAYQRESHTDLARNTLEDLLSCRSEEEVPTEALDRLARLCEASGDVERAVLLLESLREREPTRPQLSTRIEMLRKRRGGGSVTQPDDDAPTQMAKAFSEAFRYEILDEVGRGGMGVVFRARDRRLGREVALKRLPDHIRNHPKAVELFLREARSAASLNHPNIVTVYDAGQEGDSFYMTMELLRGQPLQKMLRERGQLQPGFVVKVAGQAARGLQYAHEQRIVHRDVKTANLFFTEKKVVKIMDFGLAKMVEEVRRSTTVIGGTPYYMAPEQSAGENVDHRSDLYALGVTLYELLSGRVPFRDGDVAFHHRHTEPPDLHEIAPEVPEPLVELVAELLAKDPDERIFSAGEVVRRLAEIARTL